MRPCIFQRRDRVLPAAGEARVVHEAEAIDVDAPRARIVDLPDRCKNAYENELFSARIVFESLPD